MTRLLYDLRDNPGGPLDQAIKVSNEFLPRGKMIVSTRGRIAELRSGLPRDRGQQVHRRADGRAVNRSSASASEIVTGALQDHDRAYLVGETTFGKALVQSVYRISGDAGLALTTAHYYTPSGRLIQRPWDETLRRVPHLHAAGSGRRSAHNPSDLQHTDARAPGLQRWRHRAGQVRFPGQVEGFNPTTFGRVLYHRQEFETYSQKLLAENDTRIPIGNASVRSSAAKLHRH